jgi:hypothetical protein
MNTRKFLKSLGIGTATLSVAPLSLLSKETPPYLPFLNVTIHRPAAPKIKFLKNQTIYDIQENDYIWFDNFKDLTQYNLSYFLYKATLVIKASNDNSLILSLKNIKSQIMFVYQPDQNHHLDVWNIS